MRNKSPKCPVCGKALYRTLYPKEKCQTSLYRYCRNGYCRINGDITVSGYEPVNGVLNPIKPKANVEQNLESNPSDVSMLKRRKRRVIPTRSKINNKPTENIIKTNERDGVIGNRENLSEIIKDDKAKKITAISVVVMLQELGDKDIADVVIERHGLHIYGLEAIDVGSKK
jgi:hypothetical protein